MPDNITRNEVDFDISGEIPLSERTVISATVCTSFGPPHGHNGTTVLVCEPGGSYSRWYYDADIPGYSNYSFAEHMAEKGYVVIALDHLGTGKSTKPTDGDLARTELMAQANAAAVSQARQRIKAGGLIGNLPPVQNATFVGIGHSMGGCITIIQQGAWESYDAVCILGYTNRMDSSVNDEVADKDREGWAIDKVKGFAPDTWDDVYVMWDRDLQHKLFHYSDVPSEVISEDDLKAVRWPRMSIADGFLCLSEPYARGIDVPVFLGSGEIDLTGDLRADIANYVSSRDITLFVLPESGHCHNFASTRHQMWDRIDGWITGLERIAGH